MPARSGRRRDAATPSMRVGPLLPAAMLAAFAAGATITVMGAQETWIVSALGLSHGLAGTAQSLFFVGNMIGSLGIGWLAHRATPSRLGAALLAMLLAGNALTAIPVFGAVLAGRFVAGLANSALFFLLAAVLVHRFPDRPAALLNAQHALVSLGGMAALLFSRRLAISVGAWNVPFLAVAGVCAAALAVLLFDRDLQVDAPAAREPARELLRVFRLPAVAATVALMAAYNVAEQAFSSFYPAYGEQELGSHAVTSGRFTALFWAGMGCGRLLAAALARRGRERPLLLVSALCGSTLLALAVLVRRPAPLAAAVVASGMILGPLIPLASSAIVRHAASATAGLLGISNVIVSLGGSLAPLLVGFVGDRSSLRLGLGTAYVPLLAATAVFALLTRRGHPGGGAARRPPR